MRRFAFCQKVLITITLVYMVSLPGCHRQPTPNKQIYVVFRFDDYSAISSTDIELKIIDAFRKHRASITFSVIPFVCVGNEHDPSPQETVTLTAMKGDILRAAFNDGTLDVALHGYSHQTIDVEKSTEFKGLDFNRQLERLAEGKDLLESVIGVPVTIFVPPWNSYDLSTLRALEQLGFATISAKRVGETTEDCKLNFLPAFIGLSQLRDAVKAARTSYDTQPIIVVLFHEYDFEEINERFGIISYIDFYELLDWVKSQNDVTLLSITQATKQIDDLNSDRFMLNKLYHLLSKLFHPSLRGGESNLYLKHPDLPRNLLRVGGFYLTIFGLGAVLSFFVGQLVSRRSALIMRISTFGNIVVSVGLLIYVFHDLKVSINRSIDIPYGGIMVGVGAVGICVGLSLNFLCFKKTKTIGEDRER